MKNLYIYLLAFTFSFTACKKSTDTPAPATEKPAEPTMVVKITATRLFSYNITESDTVTNDFTTRDGYDMPSLDLKFTPKPGHKIRIEAATSSPAPANALAAVVTYKGVALGPITPVQGAAYTYISFTYVVPK